MAYTHVTKLLDKVCYRVCGKKTIELQKSLTFLVRIDPIVCVNFLVALLLANRFTHLRILMHDIYRLAGLSLLTLGHHLW